MDVITILIRVKVFSTWEVLGMQKLWVAISPLEIGRSWEYKKSWVMVKLLHLVVARNIKSHWVLVPIYKSIGSKSNAFRGILT